VSNNLVSVWDKLGERVELRFDPASGDWSVCRGGVEATFKDQLLAQEYMSQVCDGIVLWVMEEELGKDILTDAYSDERVCEGIRAAGGDPDAIGVQGVLRTQQLIQERKLP
jgi:hypothetical protein